MNEQKLKRFMGDTGMQQEVRQYLQKVFSKRRSDDVHVLASQTLAQQMLDEAWNGLVALSNKKERGEKSTNEGL